MISKKKLKTKKRSKNPAEVRGSYNEAAGFQDVRFSLAAVLNMDEGENVSDKETPIDHLDYAIGHFNSQPSGGFKRNSLNQYTLEIFNSEVKKAMKEFAKVLRRSVIEVAKEYDIDSYSGEFIKE
jgi:hypothetical protein